ncbi:hypothetical protein IPP75_04280 [Candidatus Saccharibacteria bacterium]|nr:MAG: hypothetical protein IPP75_04280 [Candidatus Saccharibacteria bacterium]
MIKQRFLRFAMFGALVAGCVGMVVAIPHTVGAKSIISDACTFAPESETCKSDNADAAQNPLTGTSGTLYKVSLIVAVIAGVAAVIVMIASGIRYMTSGGDSQKVSSAKNTMVGAIAGLVIIVLAQTIITFVVKRL